MMLCGRGAFKSTFDMIMVYKDSSWIAMVVIMIKYIHLFFR